MAGYVLAEPIKAGSHTMVAIGKAEPEGPAFSNNAPAVQIYTVISLFDTDMLVRQLLDILRDNGWDVVVNKRR